jgi:hypothetical protein
MAFAAAVGLGTADGAAAGAAVGAQAATISARPAKTSQTTEPGRRTGLAYFEPFWIRIQSLTFLLQTFSMGHVAYDSLNHL